jgi:hypothetical protein
MMPRFVFAAALILSLGTSLMAGRATIRGKLVDEHCSAMSPPHDNHDNKSAKEMESCARECAASGQPVALVTSDGAIYRIVGALAANRNAKLVPHLGVVVEITGDVSGKAGSRRIAASSLRVVRK